MKVGLLIAGLVLVSGISFYGGYTMRPPLQISTEAPVTNANPQEISRVTSHSPPTQAPAPISEVKPVHLVIDAVPMRPEFDILLARNVNIRTGHSKLERQPRDPAWAAETESAFRAFLLSSPSFSRYGIDPQVDCRTSFCEVRMLAYGAEKDTKWHYLIEEPGSPNAPRPAKAFAGVIDWEEKDGVTAVYFLVSFRNRPDPNGDFPRGYAEVP